MMEEKRRHIRWQVPAKIHQDWDIPTKVHYRLEPSKVRSEALCKDITTMGMKLSLNRELFKGAVLELKISLPDYIRPLFVRGEVAWHRELEEEKYFEAGICFTKIKDSDKQRIYNFVFDLGQDEVANRWWEGFEKIGEMRESRRIKLL
ncbi:MAG: PilZ domain-containing protein [Candidatus Omnitrophica bacterium]|nr:PilZ domain-containing protein [Candidatus Omnitrophota bacterium]